ncbi:MAG: hypothetical protein H6741_25405 [Alphaproteobacteria bacterium]|nr:hypothetical protein [Alphaproteobacteria bacterium]
MSSEGPGPRTPRTPEGSRTMVVMAVLLGWTWLYNIVIKGQGVTHAFFSVIDTLSEDVVMGSVVTVVVGLCIVVLFTTTKLYTQIISSAPSFRALELLIEEELAHRGKGVFYRLLHFHAEPQPDRVYPLRTGNMLIGLSALYLMSWFYIVLFSEALFFISWSAGVDLPITDKNLQLMPTLALSIPFSARVMAYFRYPYTQDYADFMPGALFVLLLVASLGYLFESHDQKFFLLQVWQNGAYLEAFLRYGLLLAFIPVFSEAVYWLINLFADGDDELGSVDPPDEPEGEE